jgi:DNA replication protein DnaC
LGVFRNCAVSAVERKPHTMFMLVSRSYEHASPIVTSNKPFSAWGEIFGDDAVAWR